MDAALASVYTRLVNALAAVLLHGDALLTDGNTRVAALVRRVTRSPWSHVAMYVGPLEPGPDPRCSSKPTSPQA